MSDDLTKFLLARIAEDEQRARLGPPFDKPENHEDDYSRDWYEVQADAWHTYRCGWRLGEGLDDSCTCGVPARVLAECEAKRRIVRVYQALNDYAGEVGSIRWHEAKAYETVLRDLATVYSDHPDYRPEWRP